MAARSIADAIMAGTPAIVRLGIFEQPPDASQLELGARDLSAVVFAVIEGHRDAVGPKVQNVMRYRNGCVGRSIPCKLAGLRAKAKEVIRVVLVNLADLQDLAIHRGIARTDAIIPGNIGDPRRAARNGFAAQVD